MSLPGCQLETAAFLTRLTGAAPVETHISAVFVGADGVLKLKKSVRLPYLDFSALAARRHFTEREYALNKPEAPELYRAVLAVDAAPDGTLRLVPAGEAAAPADYVLHMARVPAGDFLDRIAAACGLTPALLDALGDRVAASHARRPAVQGWALDRALGEVARTAAVAARSAGLPDTRVEHWKTAIDTALGALRGWLQARAASGFVKRCHGDLHLGNVCLMQGQPVLFDALEFDESMATIDTGYDLAFLLMDLDVRADRKAANRVLNRVLARNGDAGVTRGLPAFMSLRAMVRAYVMAAAGKQDEAGQYLDRAIAYLRPEHARVVAIGGLQGSGKSTLARAIAPDLGRAPGAVVLRSDELRKRAFNVPPEQHLPDGAYSETANVKVRHMMIETARLVAEGGHAVIADATFTDPGLRSAIAGAAREAGCGFTGVWLTAPRDVLEDRLRQRRNDASDATVAVLAETIGKTRDPADWLSLDTSDMASAETRLRTRL